MSKKPVDKQEFAVTFHERHALHHPLGAQYHPRGYLVVIASSQEAAEELTRSKLANYWKDIMPLQEVIPELFPRGEIGRLIEDHE